MRPHYIAGCGIKGLQVLKNTAVEPRHYRDAMARFAGAVHVIATDGPAGKRGATVIATCSVSDNPPTILVCLNRENPANDVFRDNGVFTLNTLTAGQEELANHFSGLISPPIASCLVGCATCVSVIALTR